MTLFGIDISNYQKGINLASVKSQGYAFVAAKCTEARTYVSADYARQRDQAISVGLPFCAYHFLHRNQDAKIYDQVMNLRSHIGDTRIPIMLDVEAYKVNGAWVNPSSSDAYDFINMARAQGLKMRWLYWSGDHTLPSGMYKWHANYGANPTGYASSIYPGDSSTKWNTAVPTTIWQFGSNGKIDGWNGPVDVNAFRGSLAGLLKLDGFYVPTQAPVPSKPAPEPVPVPVPPAPTPEVPPVTLQAFEVEGKPGVIYVRDLNGVHHIENGDVLDWHRAQGLVSKTTVKVSAARFKNISEVEK